ncbi:MAG: hypothetical protein NVS4B5_11740 [Vulcanimicrobiaceae bacterium]
MRHPLLVGSAVVLAALAIGPARANAPSPESIFSAAKTAWRTRAEVPFVAFNLRERYEWRGHTHDNWWQVAYRDRDRALALRRTIVAEDEAKRLRGAAIAINFHIHKGKVKTDSLDTNRDADAFPILDPQIEPNASFGLVRREPKAMLVGSATASPVPGESAAATPIPSPTPEALASPNVFATEKPLREVGRIEAVARDYAIALAGTEHVRGRDAYHLTLTPLRDPHVNRLRDLWVDVGDFGTVQLAVQGIFQGKPYADARWTVGYARVDGRIYVQQIRTDDALRFGLDRVVTGLQFDFVAYDFPAGVPAMTFERML